VATRIELTRKYGACNHRYVKLFFMAENFQERAKAVLKFFSDPCQVLSRLSELSLTPGEHQVRIGRRELTVRVVREGFCRAAIDLMRYTGRLIRDDFRCLVYRRSKMLMACNCLKSVAIIAIRKRGTVTFYILE